MEIDFTTAVFRVIVPSAFDLRSPKFRVERHRGCQQLHFARREVWGWGGPQFPDYGCVQFCGYGEDVEGFRSGRVVKA